MVAKITAAINIIVLLNSTIFGVDKYAYTYILYRASMSTSEINSVVCSGSNTYTTPMFNARNITAANTNYFIFEMVPRSTETANINTMITQGKMYLSQTNIQHVTFEKTQGRSSVNVERIINKRVPNDIERNWAVRFST